MVSGITGSNSSYIQELMAQMLNKMNTADTDATAGLSKAELSSIDTDGDKGEKGFIKALTANFDKIDSDTNGQLSSEEINAAKPHKGPMGPPPGLSIEEMFSANDTDGTSGLSSEELASVDTGDDMGAANFIKNLTKDFDKIDTNQDSQLSKEEIDAAKPQGPPPGNRGEGHTADNNGNSESNFSEFKEKLGDLTGYLFKQLVEAYKNNESEIKSAMTSGLNSGLNSVLDLAV